MKKIVSRYLPKLLPLFLALTLVLVGCSSQYQAPQTTPAAPAAPPPAVTSAPGVPNVKITSPASGATVTGSSVQVTVQVSNFELVAPGGANAAGQGHIHYYKDVTIPTAAGQPTFSAAGTYKATPGTSVTWDNLTPGTHTLGVQLVNANHTPLSPPVTAEVTITVSASAAAPAPAPTVKFVQPTSGATLTAGNVHVIVEVSNFQLVAPGGAVEVGKGHIHYYLDVTIPTEAGKPAVSAAGTYKASPNLSVDWANVAAGTHTLGVQLVNANHTPFSPPVTAEVTITVSASAAAPPVTPPVTTAPAVPSVKIIQPAGGATMTTNSVHFMVEVSNFDLVAPGGANAAGKGHIHYYLDVTIPTEAGKPAVSAAGTYKASPNLSVDWDNLTLGTHTLGVQLINNDHTPLSPPVTAEVTITVSAPAPSPYGY